MPFSADSQESGDVGSSNETSVFMQTALGKLGRQEKREMLEEIDIGGVTLLRASSKNYTDVISVVDPLDYPHALDILKKEGKEGKVVKMEKEGKVEKVGKTPPGTEHPQSEFESNGMPHHGEEGARLQLAKKVFAVLAKNEKLISDYFYFISSANLAGKDSNEGTGLEGSAHELSTLAEEGISSDKVESRSFLVRHLEGLRYGENPNELGALAELLPSKNTEQPAVKSTITDDKSKIPPPTELFPSLAPSALQNGKAMSYNNYLDSFEACQIVRDFSLPTVAVIKHCNPCGLAELDCENPARIHQALKYALLGDRVSAYGSIIAFNRPFTYASYEQLKGIFVEIILAPSFEERALSALKKRKNLRVLLIPELADKMPEQRSQYRLLDNKLLIKHSRDNALFDKFDIVSKRVVSESEKRLHEFTFRAVKHIKSNAIAIGIEIEEKLTDSKLEGGEKSVSVKNESGEKNDGGEKLRMLLGMGAGQPNRLHSFTRLAYVNAKDNLKNIFAAEQVEEMLAKCVLASDAFFPFADSIEQAAKFGIGQVIEPGGSIRDNEVIEAADKNKMALVFTGRRHFKH